jgi:zinc protease
MVSWLGSAAIAAALALQGTAGDEQNQRLPIDPKVQIGKLQNGLTYYIRENKKPEARAELRLVVNAGSVLETDDQRGLAHFMEHMAFNGSEHFKPGELVRFLESVGLRFGADLNAYTGFDETVYLLPVPTDKPELLNSAFTVLADWARGATIDAAEVDKERGVVMDEWRRGRGANARMFDKQLPILFKGSRYADRLPIGLPEILEKAPAERIKAFYSTWYQLDNMAVIAVGDFKSDEIKKLIEKHLASWRRPSRRPCARTIRCPITPRLSTRSQATPRPPTRRCRSGTSRRASRSPRWRISSARPPSASSPTCSTSAWKRSRTRRTRRFLSAGATSGAWVRGASMFGVYAATEDGKAEAGLAALLAELKRLKEHGFTAPELERAKAEYLAFLERSYNEREKTESAQLVGDYMEHFLQGHVPLGIEDRWKLAQRVVPAIDLKEVNAELARLIPDKNRVLLASMPEKAGVKNATAESFAATLAAADKAEVGAYQDRTAGKSLVGNLPEPGKVVKVERYEPLGADVLTLSNGMVVWVKPTDFKNDQVIGRAYAIGGLATSAPANYPSAEIATDVVMQSGVAGLSAPDLQKLLAGKMASATPYIFPYQQGFQFNATPKDLETAIQLLRAYLTSPNKDETEFTNMKNLIGAQLVNKAQNPEAVYYDTVNTVNRSGHYTAEPWMMEKLAKVDLDKSLEAYRAAFANAADFTLFIVGNTSVETLKPLLEKYIANLPSTGKRTTTIPKVGVQFPKDIVKKDVNKGTEPKSLVQITWPTFVGNDELEVFRLGKACEILEIRLLEILRESLGATYSVNVALLQEVPSTEYATTIVAFGCAPDKADSMTQRVLEEVERFKKDGPTEAEIATVKEQGLRAEEVNRKQNNFWLNVMTTYHALGRELKGINDRDKRLNDLAAEAVKATAAKNFPKQNYTVVTLRPQAAGGTDGGGGK